MRTSSCTHENRVRQHSAPSTLARSGAAFRMATLMTLELHYPTNWAYEGEVDVLYCDGSSEMSYGRLAQGQTMSRETYEGHRWAVREANNPNPKPDSSAHPSPNPNPNPNPTPIPNLNPPSCSSSTRSASS